MAPESKSSREKDQGKIDWPSGSAWGRTQLDQLHFKSEPRILSLEALQSQFETLPQNLILAIERNLGSDSAARDARYHEFYDALRELSKQEWQSSPNQPRTRSATTQVKTYQSSPLKYKQGVASSQSSPSSPRSSPEAKRQKLYREGQGSPIQGLHALTPQPGVTNAGGAPSADGNPETDHYPPSSPSPPFHDLYLPSSQTDSTYAESSPVLAAATYEDQDQDQVEGNTNHTMRLLLTAICTTLTKESDDSDEAYSTAKYKCDSGTPLKVSISGDVVNTTPDLKVSVVTKGKTVVILEVSC